ncbi:DUF4249 family protein [Mucilaginibacter sp. BT774]|nr:DUF4249 family protein [Mucilaginibacter sp. BT774]MDO3626770.1 DUF4249 family protein [Mucilaginibacter sp. BT774]
MLARRHVKHNCFRILSQIISKRYYQNPILSIASSAEKLSVEYSILVKQYALSADAYKFYANLKKNTEQLGSIFDAQPSAIRGNIHFVTTPAEPVIGYLCIG